MLELTLDPESNKDDMINKDFLQSLSARLADILPETGPVREEIQKQFYKLLQGSFSRLNLVTREEFEAQLKVLERTERQLAVLEAKLAELENKPKPAGPSAGN